MMYTWMATFELTHLRGWVETKPDAFDRVHGLWKRDRRPPWLP